MLGKNEPKFKQLVKKDLTTNLACSATLYVLSVTYAGVSSEDGMRWGCDGFCKWFHLSQTMSLAQYAHMTQFYEVV